MFGYSLVKTKKLEMLYCSSSELTTSNQRLRAQYDRLFRLCEIMSKKLEENGLSVP